MSKDDELFGYWIVARDEASAREAVKMAGLPVLLVGANALVFALIALVGSPPSTTMAGVSALAAIPLIFISFRIRSGHAAWIPIACLLFCLFMGANAILTLGLWVLFAAYWLSITQIILGWIVPLICLVLTLAGLKGWLWLRANKSEISF